MLKRVAIGVRLTAWYAALLVLGLGLFSFASVAALHRLAEQAATSQLEQAITGAKEVVREHTRNPQDSLEEELGEYADALKPGVLLSVRSDHWLVRPAARPTPSAPVATMTSEIDEAGQHYSVQATISTAAGISLISEFSKVLAIAVPLMLLFACAAGYWISRRALRPFDEVTNAARSIGLGNLSARLTVPQSKDELHRLTEAWNNMLERLEKSVKRLSQFTADASHELRSPLAVIRTTAEVALRRDRPSPDYRSALEQIHSYAVRLSSLVEDLLALARTEEAKDAASAVVDLRTAVHSAQQLLSSMAEMKKIHLALEAALNGYEPKVRGDQQSIERLFTILLDNAIKYTPAHGSVSVRMWNADDTRVAVDVCDSGPGIAPEHVPHIFERFYRIDRVRTPGAGGVGLGLALAKSIAVAHGAELQVESEIDRGSTFRILFRREPVTRSGE